MRNGRFSKRGLSENTGENERRKEEKEKRRKQEEEEPRQSRAF
jgi:hypothetical protein